MRKSYHQGVRHVPLCDRLQSSGLQRGPDELIWGRDQPRSAVDLAHFGSHVTWHDALHCDVETILAAAAVLGVQFAAKLLDEFLSECNMK
jgi:hypothetical protein